MTVIGLMAMGGGMVESRCLAVPVAPPAAAAAEEGGFFDTLRTYFPRIYDTQRGALLDRRQRHVDCPRQA